MTLISRSLSLSDKSLEQVSQVTDLDSETSRALWRSRAPGQWKSLLDSQTVKPGAKLSTPFVWDASSRRYIDLRSRRYVPFTVIRDQAIEPIIRASRDHLRALGAGLQETGDLVTWERSAIEEVKTVQIAAAMAANGGASSQNNDDKEEIAALVLILLLLLRDFAGQIRTGRFPLNGLLFVRSDLYARAARGTFEEMRRFGMASYFGATEEKRVLGIADHCTDEDDPSGELSGCVELSELGYKPIGTLPRLGVSPCRSNCLCRFVYRYKDEAGRWIEVDDSATVAKILRAFNIKESVDG